MAATKLIGIDIGTQGTKAVLFDQRGRVLAAAFRKSRLHQPTPGVVEEDPEYQFKTVCQCIATCVRESGVAAGDIAAIALDGQMAGILGIGEDGRHVTPYDSWLDTRCSQDIHFMQQRAGDAIIRKTGGPVSFNHGPKILWWREQRAETYDRIACFLQPGGYAALRLCDLDASQAFIDTSYLHFSGFANNPGGVWDTELCAAFDMPLSKLPRIVAPHEVIGQTAASVARRCGLVAGIPVVAGCGDTAASFLACGATRPGVCVDVAGTASVFAATTKQFKADTQYRTLGWGRSAIPGLWHPYAYINGGGMNLEWFARELGQAGADTTTLCLQKLDRQAARLEHLVGDPLFVPHLGGRVSPSRPLLRGSWAGLTWSHTAAHLYRALLEGVALEYAVYRQVLDAVNPELKIREVRVTGGGEKSLTWSQIKADVLGVPLLHVTRREGAPLGAALLAGFGIGLFADLHEAAEAWIKPGRCVRPQRTLRAHYAERLRRYEQLLELLQQWTPDNRENQP